MQRIVVVTNSTSGSPHALDFACYLGRLTNSKISGFFFDDLAPDKAVSLYPVSDTDHRNLQNGTPSVAHQPDATVIDQRISLFKNACEKRDVRFSIHRDAEGSVKEIISESRYADIVVAEVGTSFDKKAEHFVKELLKEAECPVIVAPESFEGIDEIVFTYNGSKSSMYAIKQFCYLFPQLDDKKVTVIEVEEEEASSREERDKFREWLSGHYSSIGYNSVKGNTEAELFAALLLKKNVFIVMGAYGRGRLSSFFRHSTADLLVKTITQAIFIAHT